MWTERSFPCPASVIFCVLRTWGWAACRLAGNVGLVFQRKRSAKCNAWCHESCVAVRNSRWQRSFEIATQSTDFVYRLADIWQTPAYCDLVSQYETTRSNINWTRVANFCRTNMPFTELNWQSQTRNSFKLLLCTEDDNSYYRNVCKMSVVSFALAVVFIIRLFSTSAFRVPKF